MIVRLVQSYRFLKNIKMKYIYIAKTIFFFFYETMLAGIQRPLNNQVLSQLFRLLTYSRPGNVDDMSKIDQAVLYLDHLTSESVINGDQK